MHGVVEVEGGRVSGVERRGIWSFSGIPYAASPAGTGRWRPPAPPEPWSGVRHCERFGPVAPQEPTMTQVFPGAPQEQSDEDCLSLNVWTPGLDNGSRPVLVWIHGGSFRSGSGSSGLYRGTDLAREGDVVVVTLNYRLGILGYLAHPALGDPGQEWLNGGSWTGTGNWGLADQVTALRWVHEHISGFGGDPGCVTLFGESAGSMSVSALLAVPEAAGLFHRAILQSGPPLTVSADAAAEVAERLASQLEVACTRTGFEQVPAERLVSALAEYEQTAKSVDGLAMRPVVDGGLLGGPPVCGVASGSAASVPLLIGTNRDEWSLFTLGDSRFNSIDREGLLRRLTRVVGDQAAAVRIVGLVEAARSARGEAVTPADVWTAIASDYVFRAPSVHLADAHHASADLGVGTFAYLFTWESPIFGGILGACHALEVPFVFGSVKYPIVQAFTGGGEEVAALSGAMRRAWLSFARSGVPSTDSVGEGRIDWPGWDVSRRPTMVLGHWPGHGGLLREVECPRDEELEAVGAVLGPVPGHRTD